MGEGERIDLTEWAGVRYELHECDECKMRRRRMCDESEREVRGLERLICDTCHERNG